jgi:hypothetical protein
MATDKEVSNSIRAIWTKCFDVLDKKGKHYAGGDKDRLLNFKVGAEIFASGYRQLNMTPKRILWGYMLKHITSLCYMCHTKDSPSRADWDEKIVDTINYLLLLSAIVDEEIACEKEAGEPVREDSKTSEAKQDKYKDDLETAEYPLKARRAHRRLMEVMDDE